MKSLLAAALCCLAAAPAWAEVYSCSGTIGNTSTPLTFAGGRAPVSYLEICNAHATNTVGVSVAGGAAAIGAAGTRTLAAGACWRWEAKPAIPAPADIAVIGSAVSTTLACQFR